ncbi:DUF6087 family protein [Streptomyces sp. NPDC088915]|uniref:DUF6087 family protein n=1 Tax=Streptomyces sp. NPDC088915 TaxID=3365912 RepID=UPI0037FFED7F
MSDEEPLEQWARRREERRDRARGRLRAVPLGGGPHRGAHVEPDAPRAIEEYDGADWAVVGLVPDLAAAKAALYPPRPEPERPAEWDRPALGPGRGRHRRTAPTEDGAPGTTSSS